MLNRMNDEVAPVERQVAQRLERSLRDDDQHADRRQNNAAKLHQGDALAEHDAARGDDEHRYQRIEHRDVERGGVL
jgi:hypothetical protein